MRATLRILALALPEIFVRALFAAGLLLLAAALGAGCGVPEPVRAVGFLTEHHAAAVARRHPDDHEAATVATGTAILARYLGDPEHPPTTPEEEERAMGEAGSSPPSGSLLGYVLVGAGVAVTVLTLVPNPAAQAAAGVLRAGIAAVRANLSPRAAPDPAKVKRGSRSSS